MTEQWDGRPQNPERDGWHWLMQDTLLYPARWDAAASAWHRSRFLTPAEIARLNDYCGPCLTPAEIEARVAAARREGIEAALPLLAASDEVLSGLARGECEQFMYAKFAPVVGAFRALLEEDVR